METYALPIEIDGLPINSMVDLSMAYVSHNPGQVAEYIIQYVYICVSPNYIHISRFYIKKMLTAHRP